MTASSGPVGTCSTPGDSIAGDRIKLARTGFEQGSHSGHHHYISRGLVAEVEGDKVRLSANAAVAVTFEEEE